MGKGGAEILGALAIGALGIATGGFGLAAGGALDASAGAGAVDAGIDAGVGAGADIAGGSSALADLTGSADLAAAGSAGSELATGVAATGAEVGTSEAAGAGAIGSAVGAGFKGGIASGITQMLGGSADAQTTASNIGSAVSGIGTAASAAASIKNLVDPTTAPTAVTPPAAPTVNQAEAISEEEQNANQGKGALANLLAPTGGTNFFPTNNSLKQLLGA